MPRTRDEEIAYRCAIYDATERATALFAQRGVPESALYDLVGWVLFIQRDLAELDGDTLSDEQICARVLQAIADAHAFYQTM